MGELQRLIREGKVRAVGLSNSKPADLDAYESCGTVALVQEQFSLLAPYHGMDYFPAANRHNTSFQVYGALEEGFLTEPGFVERSFPKGDVRGKLPWIHEPIKSAIGELFKVLEPMREEYGCSYANLVQAWTLMQNPGISLLTGFTRPESIRDTCRALEVRLSEADAQRMFEAARPAQVRELDK